MDTRQANAGLEAGAKAPDFHGLLGVDGQSYFLSTFDEARILVVVFVSNGCPTVRAYEDRLSDIQRRYSNRGVRVVAVNANNPHLSPTDAFPQMKARAEARAFPFPYLKDEHGEVARAFGAVCTPHTFVFDERRRLRYQGRVDDARDPGNVTSHDLDNAIAAAVAGRIPTVGATEPFGCSIVW